MGSLLKFKTREPKYRDGLDHVTENVIATPNGDIVKRVFYDEGWNVWKEETEYPDHTMDITERRTSQGVKYFETTRVKLP